VARTSAPKLHSDAQARADLRRRIETFRDDAEPKPPRLNWLSSGFERYSTTDSLVGGCSVVLKLIDGRVFVGEVIFAGARFVTLKLWGCREPRRFERSAIAACKTVPRHSWASAHEVSRRQARGKPATVVSAKKKTP
jgi:hypothetical protein